MMHKWHCPRTERGCPVSHHHPPLHCNLKKEQRVKGKSPSSYKFHVLWKTPDYMQLIYLHFNESGLHSLRRLHDKLNDIVIPSFPLCPDKIMEGYFSMAGRAESGNEAT